MSGYTRPFPLASSRKRKEREAGSDSDTAALTTKAEPGPAPPPAGNRLLAGYLAHEFLTRGTLLGKRWDPNPARPGPVRSEAGGKLAAGVYADVACLLKTDGAHIPGIVNPTQLGRWLQM